MLELQFSFCDSLTFSLFCKELKGAFNEFVFIYSIDIEFCLEMSKGVVRAALEEFLLKMVANGTLLSFEVFFSF
jgi:hypothetical protein